MVRKCLVAAIVVVTAQAACQQAFAQNPLRPPERPTVSPYLDLANRNFSPAFSYFRRIRPEQQLRAREAELSQQVNQLQNRPLLPAPPTSLETRYRNLGQYYGNTSTFYGTGAGRFNRSLFGPRF